jgi:hypothetical protein
MTKFKRGSVSFSGVDMEAIFSKTTNSFKKIKYKIFRSDETNDQDIDDGMIVNPITGRKSWL